jgi:hypothetical protein
MYIGLIEPHQYESTGGYLEFLLRISNPNEKPIEKCIPSMATFVDVARDYLDKV